MLVDHNELENSNLKGKWVNLVELGVSFGPCLVSRKFCKIFHIFCHIESLDACMKY